MRNTETEKMNGSVAKHPNEKAIRLVDYFLQLATLRSSLIRRIDQYDAILWLAEIPENDQCFTQVGQEYINPDENSTWIEVKDNPEPEPPDVPALCKEWIDQKLWEDKLVEPELLPKISREIRNPDWSKGSDQPQFYERIQLKDERIDVQRAWDEYKDKKWQPWAEEYKTWKRVHKIYQKLFAINQKLSRFREEYELVLGFGLLTWKTPNKQTIKRHLVVAGAEIDTSNMGLQKKIIVDCPPLGTKLRIELDMLELEEQPMAEIQAQDRLSEAEDNPWNKGCIEEVLKILVHSINAEGEYDKSLEANNKPSTKPIVTYAPALILRKRSTKKLTQTFEQIRKQIEDGGSIPGILNYLAEQTDLENNSNSSDNVSVSNTKFDGKIFFPKPSNEEQLRIIETINRGNSVLVQGPPGTGKSHTIANLICHFLATEQRMLVTAKNSFPLQVLMGLLPEELRPLCINLIGDENEKRKSLETSISKILQKSQEWNEDYRSNVQKECRQLEADLGKLREEKSILERRLFTIRESETKEQTIAEGSYVGTAATIAKAVNRDCSKYESWFPDKVATETCELSTSKLGNLINGLRYFDPQKRKELTFEWRDIELSSKRFSELLQDEKDAIEKQKKVTQGADKELVELLETKDPKTIGQIHDSLSQLHNGIKSYLEKYGYPWTKNAVSDILGGNLNKWQKRSEFLQNKVISKIPKEHATEADDNEIDLPDSYNLRRIHKDANKLKEHMNNGGKLGWSIFRPKVVKERDYLINAVKINGLQCKTAEDFSMLINVLNIRIQYEKAWEYCNDFISKDDIKPLYELQFSDFEDLRKVIEEALSLREIKHECNEIMQQCSELEEHISAWSNYTQLQRVIKSCHLALANIKSKSATEEFWQIEEKISLVVAGSNIHPVMNSFLRAIRTRDIVLFQENKDTICKLNKDKEKWKSVKSCLEKLHTEYKLPKFVDYLKSTCNEKEWGERIQHIRDAWHWAYARYWIEDYISGEDNQSLNESVKQVEDEEKNIIAQLASLRAWRFCCSKLGDDHRRSMNNWKNCMENVGKGTGKNASDHHHNAQKYLNGCREAVPAWIMPLSRVWDTVSPEPNMFDVIIVDEASQCGFEALPLLYLGRKVLVVGDDQQISPEGIGIKYDQIKLLQKKHLYDFNFRTLFNINNSLFDYAGDFCRTQKITLKEHFRCMPEIIRFSNDNFYPDTPLIPLRQHGRDTLPPLKRFFVEGGYRERDGSQAINPPEADAIVKRVEEICKDSKYHGKSIGIITLQGTAQAGLIQDKLLEKIGMKELEERDLISGNPSSFQGDERDIILLSLVAAPGERRIRSLTKSSDRRRFNVACSRAKDQMILFHSVTQNDLGKNCLRRKLLNFFENPPKQQIHGIDKNELERRAMQADRSFEKPPGKFDSWFEVDVALELLRKKYDVISQYRVSGYSIDLVIRGEQAKMAIECDGDYWHGLPEKNDKDMYRQRQLERCGWEFFRLRESLFYADKDYALEKLWPLLEERSIFPTKNGDLHLAASKDQPVNEIIDNSVEEPNEAHSDKSHLSSDIESDFKKTTQQEKVVSQTRVTMEKITLGDMTAKEIQDTIIKVLERCTNNSCTLDSLTTKVLKEVGINTRGKPRKDFEKRVKSKARSLEKHGKVEIYWATNQRIRLSGQ